MDKKQNAFRIATISLVGAIIGFTLLYLIMDLALGIRGNIGSAPYDDFLNSMIFKYNQGANVFVVLGSVVFYLSVALLIANAIYIYIKRTPRYIVLPLSGFLAYIIGNFSLQSLHYANNQNLPGWYYGWALSSVIVMLVLGTGAFVVTFVFGRKLLKKASD